MISNPRGRNPAPPLLSLPRTSSRQLHLARLQPIEIPPRRGQTGLPISGKRICSPMNLSDPLPSLLLSFKLLCFSRDVEEKRGIRIRGIFRGSTFMGGSGDRSRLILSLLSDMESSGARERQILTRVWDS